MTITQLITRIRPTLQDTNSLRWTDDELEYYINDGLKDIAVRTMYNRIVEELPVTPLSTAYILDNEAIEFKSVDTNQLYTITDNQTITFTDPELETVEVVYYAYPNAVTVLADSTIPLEQDLTEALKYFVLKRCYEKEDSTENFSKASYFDNEYNKNLARNATRWHGLTDVTLAKNDFYN